jgi:hypothetical protein
VTDGAISTVGFIAGGVLLAGGVTLFFTAASGAERPSARASLAPTFDSHGAGMAFAGRF